MTIIGYIVVAFFALRFLAAMANLLFSPVLKKQRPKETPLVSVLIPARNEEKNIPHILSDLKDQSYQNIEVIVYNDQSEDRTREVAGAFSKTDQRFRLMDAPGLPRGWVGKNYACHQLAGQASGDFFLFLDADVRIGPGIIESSLAQMEKHQLKLLSIFPQQIMKSLSERITVPVMNSILLSLLPLILTRLSSRPSLAAANGQFMLFESASYLSLRPHEKAKNEPVEDIFIARLYKRKGLKMQCMTGNDTIRCRMYRGLRDSLNGLARSVAGFFGGSYLLAFFYWLAGTFGIFAVAFFLPLFYLCLTGGFIIALTIAFSMASRQPVLQNLILAPPRQLLLGAIVILAYYYKKAKKIQWKGRNVVSLFCF